MAKELPYFKFEPNEWESGLIQMTSREEKGLFIDICSLYWSRLGDLPYAFALHKLCNSNAELMQTLTDLNILKVDEGQIVIDFLDRQLDEFQKTSDKRRNAANKRWSNASAMQMHSKSNAIREDKIREEKKKEEDIHRAFAHLSISKEDFEKLKIDYTKKQIDDILDSIENYKPNTKYKNLYLTAKKWLAKELKKNEESKPSFDTNR